MIAIADTLPEFCPHCGTPFAHAGTASDFFAGATLECCNCEFLIAYAAVSDIVLAAPDTDLPRYVEGR